MNFVNNQAHYDSMQDSGVAAYEFIATLDNRISAACRTRDGETYLLEEKSVGFNYPPLHPRCRSTVCPFIEGVSRKGTRTAKVGGKNIDIPENMKYADYEKVYIKKEISLEDWRKNNLNNIATSGKMVKNSVEREENMNRRKSNLGVFAHLQVPMQKKAVEQICKKYTVNISDLTIKIHRDEELLRFGLAGAANYKTIGKIDLFPNAFLNEEELLRTVIHEGAHVKQYKKYGTVYVQEHRVEMEKVAERYENLFYNLKVK